MAVTEPDAGEADEAVVRAAWLYYIDGQTQAEVAKRLFVSRPTVGRLLDRARTEGVVRFEVTSQRLASFSQARELAKAYGLQEAIVVPASSGPMTRTRTNERLAAAAASYLRRHLHPGVVVGVAWGDTVYRTLLQLPESALDGVTFAAMTGGIDYITRTVMGHAALAGRIRAIPAPLVVSNASVAALLREEQVVKEGLALARRSSVVLTSLGAATATGSAVLSRLASEDEIEDFVRHGAVADMLGAWIDASGNVLPGMTSDRRIAVDLEELREVPTVVGIAGGAEKIPGVRAALAGRYLDVLVTDELTATALLANVSPAAGSGAVSHPHKNQEK